MGDVGFEPGTSAQEVWCATNEPPHLRLKSNLKAYLSVYVLNKDISYHNLQCVISTLQIHRYNDDLQLQLQYLYNVIKNKPTKSRLSYYTIQC